MWSGRKAAPQRPHTVLLIDRDEVATASLAQQLSAQGSHVFYTSAAHVGRRLSQEHYFDLVIVDERIANESVPPLSEVISRDGHRCVVLSVPQDCTTLDPSVRGALRRPLDADRVTHLAVDVVRNGSFEGYRHLLDVTH